MRPLHWFALLLCCAASLARGLPTYTVVGEVETEVVEAFNNAWNRLTPEHRRLLNGVALRREAEFFLPARSPLEYRLMAAAAMASHNAARHEISVYDAGVRGAAHWNGGPPSDESLDEFLSNFADLVPDGRRDDRHARWLAFYMPTESWAVGEVPKALPTPGKPQALQRFVGGGVWHALGGRATLEELLLHELAHAIHSGGASGRDQVNRYGSWATLSGWTLTSTGEPARGYAHGRMMVERPIALIRLLIGADRGASIYAPAPDARFVNIYSSYDLREDYAEATRLLVYDPARLAEVSPHKLLYINAVGWNTRLDAERPGPLWIDEETLRGAPWFDRVAEGASTLLLDARIDPFAAIGVLRAHAGVLDAADLPVPHEPFVLPTDFPAELARRYADGRFSVSIGGVEHHAHPEAVRRSAERALIDRLEHLEIELLLAGLHNGVDEAEAEAIAAEADAERRLGRLELALHGPRTPQLRALCAQLADGYRIDRPLLYHRLRVVAHASEQGDAGDRAIADAEAAATVEPVSQDLVELRAELARAAIARGDTRSAHRLIERVPGGTLGALRRAELWVELAHTEPAFVDAASEAIVSEANAAWPGLALKLSAMAERIER